MSSAKHPVPAPVVEGDSEFERLLGHLCRIRGVDFAAYKRPSLLRRLRRRMMTVSIAEFSRYTEYLEAHPEELDHLFNTLLINVTAFFRDGAPWEVLRTELIPQLLEARGPGVPIRIWSAGCASGEETYTVAMLFAEALGPDAFARRVRIYATDVDNDALAQARAAIYLPARVSAVPDELVARYFEKCGDGLALRPNLRRAVIFGRHDLLRDPPISRVSLLVCRNTLMYFTPQTQSQILSRFHDAMADDGLLLLGKAETLLTRSELFEPVDLRRRLFRKNHFRDPRQRIAVLVPPRREEIKTAMSKPTDMYSIAFEAAPIAHIVVAAEGTLAMFNDRARSLFGLAPADVGRPFHDLELSYRPVELRSLIQDAQEHRRLVVVKDVRVMGRDGEPRTLDVQVTPLIDLQGRGLGASVTFADTSRVQELQQQLSRSKQDLESTYEELQSTNEELETTNEELQSTVEELETTNEELQSTNEELETMNEELQSTNEELQSINRELRDSSEALNDVNDFLESIMRGLRGAVIVVNLELHVIAWNHRSEEMWGLRADEVRNRNVFGLDVGLPVEQFRRELRACLAGETELVTLTIDAINRRGKPLRCTVTCTPLFGKGKIQGVIVMVDEVGAA